MAERYFINRHTAALLVDRHNPQRFLSEPGLFREISHDQYAIAQVLLQQWSQSIRSLSARHAGQTAHIFGNGPSLKNFAARVFWENRLTIGINAAGHCIAPLQYWLSVDNLLAPEQRPLHDWVHRWMKTVSPRPVTVTRGTSPWVIQHLDGFTAGEDTFLPDYLFTHAPQGPMETIDQGLHWTKSSCQAGLDLARHMGCARIYLWGLDYTDRSHSYTAGTEIVDDPKDNPGRPWSDFDAHVRGFEALREACRSARIEVFNANPASMLDVFPKVQPEEAYAGDDTRAPAQTVKWFTFFTVDTPYEKIAAQCVQKFARFGLAVTPIPFPNAGDWMKNALARSRYMHSLAQIYPEAPIGLMDSDIEPVKAPLLLYQFTKDFAAEVRNPAPPYDRYQASVLIFGPTPKGREILRDWAEICQRDPKPHEKLREQLYLALVAEDHLAKGAEIVNLQRKYNRRPEERQDGDDTVILHTPASRKLLKVIGGVR
jgi:hypothetical protein